MRKNAPGSTRLSDFVSLILTALLAVQVATAYLPPVGSARAEAQELVICGAEGVQTVTLPQSKGDSPHEDMAGHCPLCIVSVSDVSATPPLAAHPVVLRSLRYAQDIGGTQPVGQTARPYAIRAPPLAV
ncbi:DUF2946 family protein [Roseovarius gahaiensis]|uniref:DUF2946 family protein n=1 Tax=Roseovarius gahaiensis TaxID=2716691 RepID=A0A967BFD1_9RHOB|nr:DUF2946 family protein [Roseovarius gahaiensis]NHQ73543.1 DUF2946 family protein [Roseovarius gahaiensis]